MALIVWDSEKELEDYIYDKYMDEHGECPITQQVQPNNIFRQPNLGSYGIADIITASVSENGMLDICVIEIKKETITPDAVGQISRYITGVNDLIRKTYEKTDVYRDNKSASVTGILLAPKITTDAAFILNYTKNIDYYEVLCDLEHGFSCELNSGDVSLVNPNYSDFGDYFNELSIESSENYKRFCDEQCGDLNEH